MLAVVAVGAYVNGSVVEAVEAASDATGGADCPYALDAVAVVDADGTDAAWLFGLGSHLKIRLRLLYVVLTLSGVNCKPVDVLTPI